MGHTRWATHGEPNDVSVEVAVSLALQKVVGAYGLLAISKEDPNLMIGASLSISLRTGFYSKTGKRRR